MKKGDLELFPSFKPNPRPRKKLECQQRGHKWVEVENPLYHFKNFKCLRCGVSEESLYLRERKAAAGGQTDGNKMGTNHHNDKNNIKS